jgi:hypothetical protein
LMGFSANLEKLDQKSPAFCKYCQVLLADFFQEHHLTPRLKRYAGTPSPGVATPTGESGRRRRQ